MQKSAEIIVGIDPGTTVAYAILDLNGNLIKTSSKKELDLSSLISEIIKFGKPIITGTDVSPPPSFVEKFATKTGSKLIHPKKDLSKKEKHDLAYSQANNIHESDALAAAFYAFKSIKSLLEKTNQVIKKLNKQSIAKEIRELVLKHNIAIKTAIQILEHTDEETKIVKKVIEHKLEKKDYLRLFEKYKLLDKDFKFLKQQNNKLLQENLSLKNKFTTQTQKLSKSLPVSKIKKFDDEKLQTIKIQKREIEEQNLDIKILKNKLNEINKIILNLNDKIILKKTKSLSADFKPNKDIIFVEDLTHFSPKAIEAMKNKISVIIYKKANRISLPFSCIKSDKLQIKETDQFVIITSQSLKKELNKKDILSKVITEFKQERS